MTATVKQTAAKTWSVMQRCRGKWRVMSAWTSEAEANAARDRFNAVVR